MRGLQEQRRRGRKMWEERKKAVGGKNSFTKPLGLRVVQISI